MVGLLACVAKLLQKDLAAKSDSCKRLEAVQIEVEQLRAEVKKKAALVESKDQIVIDSAKKVCPPSHSHLQIAGVPSKKQGEVSDPCDRNSGVS